jgi:uncharacterized alkaline shock family protein YloU
MVDKKSDQTKLDMKELQLAETIFSRDIDNKVLQGIVVTSLSQIPGIGLIEGTLFDNILGRVDKVKGITIEQDQKSQAVHVRIEVAVLYGVSIPEKAEEIQNLVVQNITSATGLRVAEVHVVFKELLMAKKTHEKKEQKQTDSPLGLQDEFGEDF